jgi:heme-degrading monooxygenase HmoA
MRIKAGMEDQFEAVNQEMSADTAPGQIAVYVYQMDRDSREFYLAVIFESREAYHANAASPEQHERFMKLMQVMESEPEWNDGEIIYANQ